MRAVHQDRHALRMGHGNDLFDRIDGSQGIGNLGDRHQFGARAQQRRKLLQDQFAGIIDRRDTKRGSGLFGQHLPGHNIRVMFHRREQDFIALSDMRPPISSAPPN